MLTIDEAVELLAGQRLAEAIVLTHDQDIDWPDIARLAGLSITATKNLADTIDKEDHLAGPRLITTE